MIVFKNGNGEIRKIREGHFEVKAFTELGYITFEVRHATLDDVIYNHLN